MREDSQKGTSTQENNPSGTSLSLVRLAPYNQGSESQADSTRIFAIKVQAGSLSLSMSASLMPPLPTRGERDSLDSTVIMKSELIVSGRRYTGILTMSIYPVLLLLRLISLLLIMRLAKTASRT